MIQIKNRLKEYREKKNLTQEDISNILKVAVSTYNQWENNKRQVKLPYAKKLADILDVTIEELFFTN